MLSEKDKEIAVNRLEVLLQEQEPYWTARVINRATELHGRMVDQGDLLIHQLLVVETLRTELKSKLRSLQIEGLTGHDKKDIDSILETFGKGMAMLWELAEKERQEKKNQPEL
jgi:hypothetical protein